MKVSGKAAAETLGAFAVLAFPEEEFHASVKYLKGISETELLSEQARFKDPVMILLSEITGGPKPESVFNLRELVMTWPFVIRSYFLLWIFETCEYLSSIEVLHPPSGRTYPLLKYLLRTRPPWRR